MCGLVVWVVRVKGSSCCIWRGQQGWVVEAQRGGVLERETGRADTSHIKASLDP